MVFSPLYQETPQITSKRSNYNVKGYIAYWLSRKRSASKAAMQPVPAEVMA